MMNNDGPGVQQLKRAMRRLNSQRAPAGIPSDLYHRLILVLIRCIPPSTPLFMDSRLFPWRNHIPTTPDNALARAHVLVDFLFPRRNENGDNALILFLDVIRDQTHPDDSCYRSLYQLRCELVRILH